MERIHTLVMIKGWLKSIPPESLNPQGDGPWRITFCGIVDRFSLVTVLFPLGPCEELSYSRKVAVSRAPARQGSRPFIPPKKFYSFQSCGHCTLSLLFG